MVVLQVRRRRRAELYKDMMFLARLEVTLAAFFHRPDPEKGRARALYRLVVDNQHPVDVQQPRAGNRQPKLIHAALRGLKCPLQRGIVRIPRNLRVAVIHQERGTVRHVQLVHGRPAVAALEAPRRGRRLRIHPERISGLPSFDRPQMLPEQRQLLVPVAALRKDDLLGAALIRDPLPGSHGVICQQRRRAAATVRRKICVRPDDKRRLLSIEREDWTVGTVILVVLQQHDGLACSTTEQGAVLGPV